ncbi:UrcA family protein [Sphingomonas jaspsi]|uniref:UrcA family protein n=1 Tax=Sphingomonas jaspsi TaxID=392409 RepID=UPI000686F06A|nr:UrcA family protein [Sphingomonas jaspsi]
MLKTILISLALAAVPALAAAEPVTEARTVKVADLDLSSTNGKAALGQRIIDACGEAAEVDLAGRNAVRACRADAHAKVAAQEQLRLARRAGTPIASGQQ